MRPFEKMIGCENIGCIDVEANLKVSIESLDWQKSN